jgi:hypothetical protein
MTIKLSDSYEIPTPEEVVNELARRKAAGGERAKHFAHMIAKAATKTLMQGAHEVPLSRGFEGSRSYILISEESVCLAAQILLDAGYVIAWPAAMPNTYFTVRGTGHGIAYLARNWERLAVRLPTKNESPLAGDSVSRST